MQFILDLLYVIDPEAVNYTGIKPEPQPLTEVNTNDPEPRPNTPSAARVDPIKINNQTGFALTRVSTAVKSSCPEQWNQRSQWNQWNQWNQCNYSLYPFIYIYKQDAETGPWVYYRLVWPQLFPKPQAELRILINGAGWSRETRENTQSHVASAASVGSPDTAPETPESAKSDIYRQRVPGVETASPLSSQGVASPATWPFAGSPVAGAKLTWSLQEIKRWALGNRIRHYLHEDPGYRTPSPGTFQRELQGYLDQNQAARVAVHQEPSTPASLRATLRSCLYASSWFSRGSLLSTPPESPLSEQAGPSKPHTPPESPLSEQAGPSNPQRVWFMLPPSIQSYPTVHATPPRAGLVVSTPATEHASPTDGPDSVD